MSELAPAVAIGYALVDYKQSLAERISFDDDDTIKFVSEAAHLYSCAGGSVANTMVAYHRYSNQPTRLFYSVGDDERGEFFHAQTGSKLGLPQIAEDSTGFCLLNLDDDGNIFDEVTLEGAAASVNVPAEELNHTENGLLISNINTLRNPTILEQTPDLLKTLDPRKGVFALRLSGAHSLLATGEEAQTALENLPGAPNVVFGNTSEIQNIFDGMDKAVDVDHLLPDARVMFVTDGGKNVLVRYEAETYTLLPEIAGNVVDVSGAGDHFMGVTLAEMMCRPAAEWTPEFVLKAASTGIKAAGLVLATMNSRLSVQQLNLIRTGDYRELT